METIQCAAIKWCYADETEATRIVRGHNHAYCIAYFSAADIYSTMRNMSLEQSGFLTNEDRFVDRGEAYRIAEAAGQLKSPRIDRILYSEFCNYLPDPTISH